MIRSRKLYVGVLCSALLCAASATAADAPDRAALAAQASALFGKLPAQADRPADPVTPEQIALGRMLFYDGRLSKDGTISCNSCHLLDHYGVDGKPTSPGFRGQLGERNSPSVYNAAIEFAQFWDGRAADVEAQALGPVLNPVEMAMPSDREVIEVIAAIPGYPPLFAAAFPGDPEPVRYANVGRAIGAFERQLLTPAPIDRFAAGQLDALSDAQLQGFQTFVATGCPTCHVGPGIGGGMFQKLGVVHPYDTRDPGREAITKNPADLHVFKVPSLRNVAKTGPYFHDGSIRTLDEAIRKMAWHQLGVELDDAQVAQIATFLTALTGDLPTAKIAKPELP